MNRLSPPANRCFRKALAWLPMHACYYIGHAASLVLNRWPDCADGSWMDRLGTAVYRVYNMGMCLSCDINDWAGFNLWKHHDYSRKAD